MDVFIARQAILDKEKRLHAYELFFRPCQTEKAGTITDDSTCTLQVMATALLSAGLSVLSEQIPFFINFGQDLLTTDWTSLFPPSSVVIEILETVEPDPEVIAACVALRQRGYALALDDVTDRSDPTFLDLADLIKIDFRATSPESQALLASRYGRAGKRLLAEKVETLEEFERAKGLGFHYFQGFFFSKPVLLQGHEVSAMKGSIIKLLAEVQAPDMNFREVESLIKCDVSLTYKLLRYANSALFARSKPISEVRGALIALGENDIRRWIILATLLQLSSEDSKVLAEHALVRARFCESLASAAGSRCCSNAFIVGMFSLLDALTHRPLPSLLNELHLPEEIVGALLGQANDSMGTALELAKCYECADWTAVANLASRLGVPEDVIADAYLGAVNWAGVTINGIDGCRRPAASTQMRPASDSDPSSHTGSLRALQQNLALRSAPAKSALELMRTRR